MKRSLFLFYLIGLSVLSCSGMTIDVSGMDPNMLAMMGRRVYVVSTAEKRRLDRENFLKDRMDEKNFTIFRDRAGHGFRRIVESWDEACRRRTNVRQNLKTRQEELHCYPDCKTADFVGKDDDFNAVTAQMGMLIEGQKNVDCEQIKVLVQQLERDDFKQINDLDIEFMKNINVQYDVLLPVQQKLDDMENRWKGQQTIIESIIQKKEKKCVVM